MEENALKEEQKTHILVLHPCGGNKVKTGMKEENREIVLR
jgi:hypothetical protein